MSENLRMAPFLREKCAQNQYGLRYLDQEKTLLSIPWPAVPKNSEGVPPGCELFHKWSEMSFARRGTNEANREVEPPAKQKHRFRNALKKARGIVLREDIKLDGELIFQFVDQRTTSARMNVQTGCAQTSFYPAPSQTGNPQNDFQNVGMNAEVAVPATSSDCIIGGDVDCGFLDELLAPHQPIHDQAQAFNQATDVMDHRQVLDDLQSDVRPWPIEEQSQLEVKVRFRQDEASRSFVTNQQGCRVFFGQNVLDLSQFVDRQHLDVILSKFRYKKDVYYGPETLQQIALPFPNQFMKTSEQKRKTEEILTHMERGLLLCVDNSNSSQQMGIPDIYAMRLCQTRVFPCNEDPSRENEVISSTETLRRMKWTKVFDGKEFYSQFVFAGQCSYDAPNFPRPTFSFSLGQRPSGDEQSLFVCVTVTVLQAQRLIQNRLDYDRDVCISSVKSADLEARALASSLAETLCLQACT